MQLPSTYYPNNSRVVIGTPQIFTDDVILLCDTSLAPVTINLLDIPDDAWMTTYKLYVVDQSSNSSVNNITINAGIGQTINNQASVVLTNNGECALIRIVGNSQYLTDIATIVSNPLEILDEGNVLTTNASSINFIGQGVTATNVGDNITVNVPIQPAYTTVQEEGVSLPQRTTIDFQGTGVTATDNGSKTIVTIVENSLDTLNEGVSLTTNTASMNFVGDLVNATTIGDNVTVNINTFGGLRAQGTPDALPTTPFALANAICFEPAQIIPQIYDDANAYDPLTGIWTCPANGRYNLSCYAHYSRDIGTGWYDPANPGGMFCVGVFSTTGCNFYCANWMTVMGIQKHIDITAQAIGMNLLAGLQLSVKVLNQTGYAYTPTVGDAIRFSIERIK